MIGLKVIYLEEPSKLIIISISNIKPISFSVPQGSILGPLLFIIYINDFSKFLKYSNNLSFADDTTIILSAKIIIIYYIKKEIKNAKILTTG